jgi:hypothetical protein
VRGGWRLLLIPAAAVAAVALFFVFRGTDDEDMASPPPPPPPPPTATTPAAPPPPPRPAVLEILIPTNFDGVVRPSPIPRGRRVVLVVSGPQGEEVHLHGYDVLRRIGPNGVARLPFRATIPGRFEVELEASHRQIADLTVR